MRLCANAPDDRPTRAIRTPSCHDKDCVSAGGSVGVADNVVESGANVEVAVARFEGYTRRTNLDRVRRVDNRKHLICVSWRRWR